MPSLAVGCTKHLQSCVSREEGDPVQGVTQEPAFNSTLSSATKVKCRLQIDVSLVSWLVVLDSLNNSLSEAQNLLSI